MKAFMESGHETLKAVSYTHLDVYKRQMVERRPSKPNAWVRFPSPAPVWFISSVG